MDMFTGAEAEQVLSDLSDSSIYGEEGDSNQENPQAGLVEEGTGEESKESAVNDQAQPVDESKTEKKAKEEVPKEQPTPEPTYAKAQYDAAVRGMNEAQRAAAAARAEAEEFKQKLATLEQQRAIQTAAEKGKPLSKEEQGEFLKRFLQNPEAEFYRMQQEAAEAAKASREQDMQAVVRKVLAPVLEQAQEAQYVSAVEKARTELAKEWPLIVDKEKEGELAEKLIELSQRKYNSDTEWRRDAKDNLMLAAISLWGLPKQLDQATLDRTAATAKAEAIAELSRRESGKAEASPVSPAVVPVGDEDPDEKLFGAMKAVYSGNMFG